MFESYDHNTYTNSCRHCLTPNSFTQEREITERRHLDLGDGFIDVDSEDMDSYTDWKYTCTGCGIESEDIEDLLDRIGH